MNSMNIEVATLGGGCFWCLEAVFDEVVGVVSVESGYSGGDVVQPSYKQVCDGKTGHAEVIRVQFDPQRISYRGILEIFFSIHNPTTIDRQGADVGPQYRSVIFFHDENQKAVAEEVMSEVGSAGIWKDPLVTQLVPFEAFYEAEDYHQEYFRKNPYQGYCQVVISPKLAKFREKFASQLKS